MKIEIKVIQYFSVKFNKFFHIKMHSFIKIINNNHLVKTKHRYMKYIININLIRF